MPEHHYTSSSFVTIRAGSPCQPLCSRLAICVLISMMSASMPARAQFTYIDTVNPTGIPDITQGTAGICAASAMTNAFWNWSAYAPFNVPSPPGQMPQPLFGHTDPNNFATNWGADTKRNTLLMADKIYGVRDPTTGLRTGGLGTALGAEAFALARGQSFNKNTYPNGLSIEPILGWQNITYSQINALVQGQAQNAVLGIKWYDAIGNSLLNPTTLEEYRHAVTLTGMDNTNKRMAISNPWGDHAAPNDPNPPVSTNYYDIYTLDPNQIANDRAVIQRNGAGNLNFVSEFDNIFQTADSIWVDGLYKIKSGGSPNVTGSITDASGFQSLRYEVENPDSTEDIYNVYILLNQDEIDVTQAYLAAQSWLTTNEPQWTVSILDPNAGMAAKLFGIIDSGPGPESPDYELTGWQSGAAGLVFSTTSSPLSVGESVTLGFDMPGYVSWPQWDNVYAVANIDSSHAWLGSTSAPEPASHLLLLVIVLTRGRSRTKFRWVGQPGGPAFAKQRVGSR